MAEEAGVGHLVRTYSMAEAEAADIVRVFFADLERNNAVIATE